MLGASIGILPNIWYFLKTTDIFSLNCRGYDMFYKGYIQHY